MLRLQKRAKLHVRTPSGTIQAERVVLALNAWSVRIAELRRALVVISSEMIATEPIPERLHEIGWSNGLAISDSRMMVNYYRTTHDGRIAFGKGGGTLCFGSRVRGSFAPPGDRAADVISSLHSLYPTLADVAIPLRWSGPIDRSSTGLPFFGELSGRPGTFFGAGYSGNGVGPSYLGAQILASLALAQQDDWATTPLARGPSGRFPPEPIRYLGGRLVRAAVARKEGSEDQGRRPGKLTRLLAGLAPTGLVPVEPRTHPHPATRS
jgi:glycine/D-amino acid oxidase-like deaminating enzyme